MKTLMIAAAMLVGCVLVPLGCSKKPNKVFTSAYVKVSFDPKGDQTHANITLSDPTEIHTLLSYFPHFLEGNSNYETGSWIASVEITFVRADGSTARLITNYEVWNEGKGDHPVEGDFAAYIQKNVLKTPPGKPAK